MFNNNSCVIRCIISHYTVNTYCTPYRVYMLYLKRFTHPQDTGSSIEVAESFDLCMQALKQRSGTFWPLQKTQRVQGQRCLRGKLHPCEPAGGTSHTTGIKCLSATVCTAELYQLKKGRTESPCLSLLRRSFFPSIEASPSLFRFFSFHWMLSFVYII